MSHIEVYIIFTLSAFALLFSVTLAKHSRLAAFSEPRRRYWANVIAALVSAGTMIVMTRIVSDHLHCFNSILCWFVIGSMGTLAITQGWRAFRQTHKFKVNERMSQAHLRQFPYTR